MAEGGLPCDDLLPFSHASRRARSPRPMRGHSHLLSSRLLCGDDGIFASSASLVQLAR